MKTTILPLPYFLQIEDLQLVNNSSWDVILGPLTIQITLSYKFHFASISFNVLLQEQQYSQLHNTL